MLMNDYACLYVQNRKVCVLCNLKPATMRGIKSHAMVLAASDSEHTKVEFAELLCWLNFYTEEAVCKYSLSLFPSTLVM